MGQPCCFITVHSRMDTPGRSPCAALFELSASPSQSETRTRVYHESRYSEDISSTGYSDAEEVNPSLGCRSWKTILHDNAEDKFAGLSRMAYRYFENQNDKYLAGFWLNSLLHRLGWHVGFSTQITPVQSTILVVGIS